MIGIYDRDFIEEYPKCKYNIQVMKLSRFYKDNNIGCELFSDLSLTTSYEKVYYFQDGDYDYPEECLLPNVEVRGYSFGQKYVPLPHEIEICQPDTSIYRRVLSRKGLTTDQEKWLERMDSGIHFQIFGTGVSEDEWPQTFFNPQRTKYIFIHDKELGGDFDFGKLFNRIVVAEGRPAHPLKISVVWVYEIKITNVQTYLTMSPTKVSRFSRPMHFNGKMSLKEYWRVLKTLHIPEHKFITFFDYPAVDNLYDEEKMYEDMIKKVLITKDTILAVFFCYLGVVEELSCPAMWEAIEAWGRVRPSTKDQTLIGAFSRLKNREHRNGYKQFPALQKYLKVTKANFEQNGEMWAI